jgi:hypothetical protein
MAAVLRQLTPSVEASTIKPDAPLELEIIMSRIALICSFAALLAACGTQSASQSDWAKARLACADVGIAPGSGAFGQCVVDLYYSLWDEQNVAER